MILPKDDRDKYCFTVESTTIVNEDMQQERRYCITLADKDTDIPLVFTGLEHFLTNSRNGYRHFAPENMREKCIIITTFLNFLLANSEHDLCEVNIGDIHNYLVHIKNTVDGNTRTISGWRKYRDLVYGWIQSIDETVPGFFQDLDTDKLYKSKIIAGRPVKVYADCSVNINSMRSREAHKKNRVIGRRHMQLLVDCAKKYDPEIALALMLQAYAGLREGEVCNLTNGSFDIDYMLGKVSGIKIDLTHDAPWIQNSREKNLSRIKKYREQKVYMDFLDKVKAAYEDHINRHSINGDIDDDVPYDIQPLFICKGKPMSISTYRARVKRLFYRYFLPSLKRICDEGDVYDENAAFIHAYEEEYPGAHMCRHWFTMYLLTVANLEREQVSMWRGDKCMQSIDDYIHVNADMIDLYEQCTVRFQEEIVRKVMG